MDTQREELAKHGIDHDEYEIFLSAPDPKMGIDDETTGIMVRKIATGKQIDVTVPYSRRQLAEPDNPTYIDTIVKLINELEAK